MDGFTLSVSGGECIAAHSHSGLGLSDRLTGNSGFPRGLGPMSCFSMVSPIFGASVLGSEIPVEREKAYHNNNRQCIPQQH